GEVADVHVSALRGEGGVDGAGEHLEGLGADDGAAVDQEGGCSAHPDALPFGEVLLHLGGQVVAVQVGGEPFGVQPFVGGDAGQPLPDLGGVDALEVLVGRVDGLVVVPERVLLGGGAGAHRHDPGGLALVGELPPLDAQIPGVDVAFDQFGL